MIKSAHIPVAVAMVCMIISCGRGSNGPVGSGLVEATEMTISAEIS